MMQPEDNEGSTPIAPEDADIKFIKISAYATVDTTPKYTIFILKVNCTRAHPSSWYVYRRYSDFRDLRHGLKDVGFHVPPLPPKKFIGNFRTHFIKQRKAELENWLRDLSYYFGENSTTSAEQKYLFKRFLILDANYPPQKMRVKSSQERVNGNAHKNSNESNGNKNVYRISETLPQVGSNSSRFQNEEKNDYDDSSQQDLAGFSQENEDQVETYFGNNQDNIDKYDNQDNIDKYDNQDNIDKFDNQDNVHKYDNQKQDVYDDGDDDADVKDLELTINEDEMNNAFDTKQKFTVHDFNLIRVIGKGSFGKVLLVCKKDTHMYYAMKVLNKEDVLKGKQEEHARAERSILEQINHPFIVRLHYAFQTPEKLYFVLDFCAGGELFFHLSKMRKFPEDMTCFYAAEISLGLGHLHAHKIVYRDLKPENILLDHEGHLKLADFGLAKEGIEDGREGAKSLCGTPEYLSPELLDRRSYGFPVDWWNLGMVTYEMLTGLPPWYTTNRNKLFQRIRSSKLTFPEYVSEEASDFIRCLLNRDPDDRLGSQNDVESVKEHIFFQEMNWVDLYNRKIPPPFNPCVDCENMPSENAISNFAAEFTEMSLSFDQSGEGSHSGVFENFTFVDESALRNSEHNF